MVTHDGVAVEVDVREGEEVDVGVDIVGRRWCENASNRKIKYILRGKCRVVTEDRCRIYKTT